MDDETCAAPHDAVENPGCGARFTLWLRQRVKSLELRLSPDGSIDMSGYVVIDHNSERYLMFNFFVTFCCLVSSYIYVYMAAHRIQMESSEDPLSPTVFLVYFFEGVFALDIGVNCLLSFEQTSQYGTYIETSVGAIASHYLYSTFYKDFLPIIPFQLTPLANRRGTLFYLIKLLRLAKGFKLLDVVYLMKKIKAIYKQRGRNLIRNEPDKANDTVHDHNKVLQQMAIGYVLKIAKNVIIIANFSYLLGMFWYIMCVLIEDVGGYHYASATESGEDGQAFIPFYGLQEKSQYDITVILLYYAFTSLSTVGFGDFVPRSDTERAVGAAMLLSGVAIFSYIMGTFIAILESYMEFKKEIEFDEDLAKFMSLICEFNNKELISESFKIKIESYFDYRWKNDKNIAFQDKEDLDIYD